MNTSLLDVKRRPLDEVIAGLRSTNRSESEAAGRSLVREAANFNLDLRSYLTLAVKPDVKEYDGLNGYEMTLAALGLPVKNDLASGVVLQAAGDTFQTFPGTRAMFPTVIDDMLRWTYAQDQFENTAAFVAVSRPVAGPELLHTIVDDKASDYESATVPEGARIPIRSLRTSEQTVRFYKHGSGIRTTYEFNRRASLEVLTPFAARVARELELSKVNAGTAVLVNGDGSANSAAPVVAQSSFNSATGETATNGKINYLNLLAWLVSRAKLGLPIDTVVGNWDAYLQWLVLFNITGNSGASFAEALAKMAGVSLGKPGINIGNPTFALSSAAPANKLIGLIKSETLEELVETGSDISEQERAITNQTVTVVRTQNTGYRLAMKDTRSIYNFGG